jgi:hypothetical protein
MANEGTIAGILFIFCIVGIPIVYALLDAQKKRQEREIENEEIRQHSTSIPSWTGSEASIIERPNRPASINIDSKMQLCPHLTRLSSLMIKCPRCQRTFSRFFPKLDLVLTPLEYSMLKQGTLSTTEIMRRIIRENGCPSTFKCPSCNTTIVRSREPSGMCQLHNRRVRGEKLFCCTINECV